MGKVVETMANEKTTVSDLLNQSEFVDVLQGALGVSPLAVGQKFTTDDLIDAVKVTLRDFDWVDYVERAGDEDEREVHFTVWSTTIINDDGDEIDGYYQGGTVLNKLATAIETKNLRREMGEYGIHVSVSWGKTNNKNKIALFTVVR